MTGILGTIISNFETPVFHLATYALFFLYPFVTFFILYSINHIRHSIDDVLSSNALMTAVLSELNERDKLREEREDEDEDEESEKFLEDVIQKEDDSVSPEQETFIGTSSRYTSIAFPTRLFRFHQHFHSLSSLSSLLRIPRHLHLFPLVHSPRHWNRHNQFHRIYPHIPQCGHHF